MEEVLKLLQELNSKIATQDKAIATLSTALETQGKVLIELSTKKEDSKKEETTTENDVVAKQRMLDEAKATELKQLATTKAVYTLEKFLEDNYKENYAEIKEIVANEPTVLGKLAQLQKAVFYSKNPIDKESELTFGSLKGNFAEEGSGMNLTINSILKAKQEEDTEAPNYFAKGGKNLTKEGLLDKIADFYKKTTLTTKNELLPRVVNIDDNLQGA